MSFKPTLNRVEAERYFSVSDLELSADIPDFRLVNMVYVNALKEQMTQRFPDREFNAYHKLLCKGELTRLFSGLATVASLGLASTLRLRKPLTNGEALNYLTKEATPNDIVGMNTSLLYEITNTPGAIRQVVRGQDGHLYGYSLMSFSNVIPLAVSSAARNTFRKKSSFIHIVSSNLQEEVEQEARELNKKYDLGILVRRQDYSQVTLSELVRRIPRESYCGVRNSQPVRLD